MWTEISETVHDDQQRAKEMKRKMWGSKEEGQRRQMREGRETVK